MKLVSLETFVALAECLNYHRAAEHLGCSQSAVSRQVAQLEDELGSQLVNRSHRQIQLTPAGKIFAKEAKQLLAQLERTIKHVKDVA